MDVTHYSDDEDMDEGDEDDEDVEMEYGEDTGSEDTSASESEGAEDDMDHVTQDSVENWDEGDEDEEDLVANEDVDEGEEDQDDEGCTRRAGRAICGSHAHPSLRTLARGRAHLLPSHQRTATDHARQSHLDIPRLQRPAPGTAGIARPRHTTLCLHRCFEQGVSAQG